MEWQKYGGSNKFQSLTPSLSLSHSHSLRQATNPSTATKAWEFDVCAFGLCFCCYLLPLKRVRDLFSRVTAAAAVLVDVSE